MEQKQFTADELQDALTAIMVLLVVRIPDGLERIEAVYQAIAEMESERRSPTLQLIKGGVE